MTLEDQCCYIANIDTDARSAVDDNMKMFEGHYNDLYIPYVIHGYISGLNKLLETCYKLDFFERYILTLSAIHGSIKTYKCFVGRQETNVHMLFMDAATHGQVDFIKMLIDDGNTIDINDVFNQAAFSGQVDVAKYAMTHDTFAVGQRSDIMKYLANSKSWNRRNARQETEIYNLVIEHNLRKLK